MPLCFLRFKSIDLVLLAVLYPVCVQVGTGKCTLMMMTSKLHLWGSLEDVGGRQAGAMLVGGRHAGVMPFGGWQAGAMPFGEWQAGAMLFGGLCSCYAPTPVTHV